MDGLQPIDLAEDRKVKSLLSGEEMSEDRDPQYLPSVLKNKDGAYVNETGTQRAENLDAIHA